MALSLSKDQATPDREPGRGFQPRSAVISRTITRALREGLVEVRKAKAQRPPARKEQLERLLHERYGQLRTCVVLECDEPDSAAADDHLHNLLGAAMAGVLGFGSGSVFRDDDVVGIGSGRSVFYTIHHLSEYPPLRAQVSLCSITGQVQPRDHARQVNLLLDADRHLGLLGLCFSRPVSLHPLAQGLACSTPEEAARAIARSHLGEASRKRAPFTHALLGVGVLAEGHRFYTHINAEEERRSRLLRSIEEPLTRLVRTCEKVKADYGSIYSPVADLSNRPFFVPVPATLHVPSPVKRLLEKKVTSLIAEINARLVTATERQLQATSQILLVAGARRKALAVKTLLQQQYPIGTLCIDQHLAADLLA